MKLRNIIRVFIFLIITSCSDSELGDCFKNTGSIISEIRQTKDFKRIHMNDNINVFLQMGDSNHVEIEAGENLLPKIETYVEDSVLYLKNKNSCNWVRSYNKEINAFITVNHIDSIIYNSSGDLICLDTLQADSISLSIHGGCGIIDLLTNVTLSHINYYYGTADINLKGGSKVTYIFAGSYGPINAFNLETDFLYMRSKGTNHCYVHVNKALEAEILNIGNIYYKGNPYSILSTESSTGKLIKYE